MAGAHLLHDFCITCTVERRHAREKDVSDDACGPDVALRIIVLVQHFGSDVVRRAQLLVKLFGGVVDERRAEIDDFNLIEFLVLLEQNVFRLQVAARFEVKQRELLSQLTGARCCSDGNS